MEKTQTMDKSDNAKVRIPPPLCFGVFLIGGILLQSSWMEGEWGPLYASITGGVLFIASLIVVIIEALRHERSGSNVEPWKPTTLILSSGAYAYSRNPIYVGMIVAYLGVAFAASSLVAVALLPLAILIIRYYVIAREEAYLIRKFGDEYLDYMKKVRRWI